MNQTRDEWSKEFQKRLDEIRQMIDGIDPYGPRSNRGKEWLSFSAFVGDHIETYTVAQYGDAPGDQASSFTEHDLALQIKKYVNRLESSARGPEEAQRDLLKIAHYCAMLYFKRAQA